MYLPTNTKPFAPPGSDESGNMALTHLDQADWDVILVLAAFRAWKNREHTLDDHG